MRFRVAFLLSLLGVVTLKAQTPALHWIASTEAAPWHEMHAVVSTSPATSVIELDASQTFQTMDGFGSCFNDLGWEALQALDAPAREAALKALFAPEGANFNLGRAPMGANDFSTGWYSYDETPGDYALTHFSIEHDRQTLIPFIHAAMKYQPKLGVWAVPWSPPTWMKTNNAYKGGDMKSDPATLRSYALYFSKYVQAYRKEGMPLYAVMPQNEPKYNNNVYPQALWTGALMNTFLRDYLLPRLKQDRVDIQVWQGTIVNENLADFIQPVLGDPVTNPQLTGIAYQYGGQQTMLATHQQFPNKKMMQSETECYNGDNTWEQGLTTFHKIIEDTSNFAGSYFFWNTVLNDEEKSHWGWRQNSLLTVDRKTKEVRYNPEFYSMKHFSAEIVPGAVRIASHGGPFHDLVAFRNPDGSRVVVFENSGPAVTAAIKTGTGTETLQVPAKSMNSVTLRTK